jgi:hypothetical protein
MRRFRTASLYLVTGCCFAILGQDAPPQLGSLDPATYEGFFCEVSQLTPGLTLPRVAATQPTLTLNGQTTNFVQPTLEGVLGITTEEAQLLTTVAKDYTAKSVAFTGAMREAFLQIRLAIFAEEAPPESAVRQYNELKRQQAQMVLDHVQELKSAFGESRFRLIETFLDSRKGNSGSLFGLPPAVARPANRTADN